MRNVTISLSEDVVKWARGWAAEHDSSVSRIVGDMLRERMADERVYASSMRAFLGRMPTVLNEARSSYPDRASLHDRDALR